MNPAEESRKRRDYDALKPRTEQPISPPPKRRAPARTENPGNGNAIFSAGPGDIPSAPTKKAAENLSKKTFPSPIQLNFVERLPASSNVDCISLASVLGDPMIKEVWLFNYLFDLDFVM